MYPGDPDADPANVYNCRCTLGSEIIGFKKKDGTTVLIDEGESGIIKAEPASRYVNSSDTMAATSDLFHVVPEVAKCVQHNCLRIFWRLMSWLLQTQFGFPRTAKWL